MYFDHTCYQKTIFSLNQQLTVSRWLVINLLNCFASLYKRKILWMRHSMMLNMEEDMLYWCSTLVIYHISIKVWGWHTSTFKKKKKKEEDLNIYWENALHFLYRLKQLLSQIGYFCPKIPFIIPSLTTSLPHLGQT